MTILTTIPNGASYKDIRDTLNSVLARILALESGVAPAPSPTLSLSSAVNQAEGNSGTATVTTTATVNRNGVSGALVVNLVYAGTATSGTDYQAGPASITIASGQSTATFDLAIIGDATVESDETIIITATLAAYPSSSASRTITITNDDVAVVPAPSLSLSSALTQAEGNSGTSTLTWTLTLVRDGSTAAFPYSYAVTGNGANPADAADFGGTFPSGSGTFAAGETSKTITVLVAGDTAVEPNETFLLTVTAAGLNTVTSAGTISNDDTAGPSNATLTPATVALGDSWYGNANPPYPGFYMGAYFNANPARKLVNLGRGGIGLSWMKLRRPDVLGARPYVIFISVGRNDFMNDSSGFNYSDAYMLNLFLTRLRDEIDFYTANLPGVRIVLETLTEIGTASGHVARFNSQRGAVNTQMRTWLSEGVVHGIVDIGGDATLGAVGAMVPVSVITNDGLHLLEGGAGYGNTLARPIFAAAANAIYASTPVPTEDLVSAFTISAPLVPVAAEGNTGTTAYDFTVTRAGGLGQAASVDWAVTGSTANPATASDFVGGVLPSGTLNFAAGVGVMTLSIAVQGDTTFEQAEGFTVTLTNPKLTGTLATATATASIVNDDAQPPSVTYNIHPTQRMSASGNSLTTSAVTLKAGKLLCHVHSDYGRVPDTVIARKAGQTDVALTLQTATNMWLGDIPVDGADWQIVQARAASVFVNQYVTAISIMGSTGTPAQINREAFTTGNASPRTTATSYALPTNGVILKIIVAIPGGSNDANLITALANNDSGVVKSDYTGKNFDNNTIRIVVNEMTTGGPASETFAPSTFVSVGFEMSTWAKA